MPPELFQLSHSKVQSFFRCPKQYWWEYLSDLPKPEDPLSAPGIVGKSVHNALRVFSETGDPEDGRSSLSIYLRMPAHDVAGPGTADWDRAFRLFAAGCSVIEGIRSERSWAERDTYVPVKRRGISISARVDRIDRLTANEWQVIDWKTGYADRDEETDAQLDLGHLAARTSLQLPREATVTAIAWNLHTGHKRPRVLTRDDAAATVRYYAGVARRMQEHTEWQATPSGACRFCKWRPQCPDAARVEESPWDEDEDEATALAE